MSKRVRDEIIGVAVCLISMFFAPLLIHSIESMSIIFKTNPAHRCGQNVTLYEVIQILVSYLFRLLPLLLWLVSIKRRILQGTVRKYLEMAVYTAIFFVSNSFMQHAVFVSNFFYIELQVILW